MLVKPPKAARLKGAEPSNSSLANLLGSSTSLASIASVYTSSNSSSPSIYTAISSDTVPGIGSISGKGIKAFGKFAWRGVERIYIERKLSAARAVFPHEDSATSQDLDIIYEELLELTRPDLYPLSLRNKALSLLLLQIEYKAITRLMKSLAKWPCLEITLFLKAVIGHMVKDMLNQDGRSATHMRRETFENACQILLLQDMLRTSRANPLLHLAANMANSGDVLRQAVVNSGLPIDNSIWTTLDQVVADASPSFPRRKACWNTFKEDDPFLFWRLDKICQILEEFRFRADEVDIDGPLMLSALIAWSDLFDLVTSNSVGQSVSETALQHLIYQIDWYRSNKESILSLATAFIDGGFDGLEQTLSLLVARLHEWGSRPDSFKALPGVSRFWSSVIETTKSPYYLVF